MPGAIPYLSRTVPYHQTQLATYSWPQYSNIITLLLIFILLRKAKRAMVPNSMEANFKREATWKNGYEREVYGGMHVGR